MSYNFKEVLYKNSNVKLVFYKRLAQKIKEFMEENYYIIKTGDFCSFKGIKINEGNKNIIENQYSIAIFGNPVYDNPIYCVLIKDCEFRPARFCCSLDFSDIEELFPFKNICNLNHEITRDDIFMIMDSMVLSEEFKDKLIQFCNNEQIIKKDSHTIYCPLSLYDTWYSILEYCEKYYTDLLNSKGIHYVINRDDYSAGKTEVAREIEIEIKVKEHVLKICPTTVLKDSSHAFEVRLYNADSSQDEFSKLVKVKPISNTIKKIHDVKGLRKLERYLEKSYKKVIKEIENT